MENKENKMELIVDAIKTLDWSDDLIPEIMEGFFNNPSEVLDNVLADSEMSEEHINSLYELLGGEEE